MALIRPSIESSLTGNSTADIVCSPCLIPHPIGDALYYEENGTHLTVMVRKPWFIISRTPYKSFKDTITLKLVIAYDNIHIYSIIFCCTNDNYANYYMHVLEPLKFDMIIGRTGSSFGLICLAECEQDRVLVKCYSPIVHFYHITQLPKTQSDLLVCTMQSPLTKHHYGYDNKYVGYIPVNVNIMYTVPFDCEYHGEKYPGMLISFTYRDSQMRSCVVFMANSPIVFEACINSIPVSPLKAVRIIMKEKLKKEPGWIVFFGQKIN